jgi:hypothetical protein
MANPDDILERSRRVGQRAREILDALELFPNWSRFGRAVLVGAVAHGLALDPDIDLEIYCPRLRPEDGFAVLAQTARHPGLRETLFQNHMHGPDKALYWQIRFLDADDVLWKVDMWSAPDDYALPRGEDLVAPLARALTPETRRAILELKAWRAATPNVACLSIDLYRAVVADGVRDPQGLRAWLASHETGQLTDWKP